MVNNNTLRVAWLGPAPEPDRGGVPAMAALTLTGLADAGVELEAFLDGGQSDFLHELARRPNVTITSLTRPWRYGRWYSSSPLTSLASGTAVRTQLGASLAKRVADRHARRPFDVLYRLSQIELLALRPLLRKLPPIVVHPEVHAHGELRHHWRERAIARRCESVGSFAVAHAYLAYRARVQRRDLRDVRMLVAPSERFAAHLAADYGVPRSAMRVIPNPIDLDRFALATRAPTSRPVRLLYVSRLSVRKGFEQIVELSHRLADLAGRVRIDCLGGPSLFSNYAALRDDLNPAIARHLGHLPVTELPDLYRSAHACLQPSMYEPFALTVGEALACGLSVIASDEVGAAEAVDPLVGRIHAAGDVDGMEREVRRLVDEIEAGFDPGRREIARRHAERRFSARHVGRELAAALAEAAAPRGVYRNSNATSSPGTSRPPNRLAPRRLPTKP